MIDEKVAVFIDHDNMCNYEKLSSGLPYDIRILVRKAREYGHVITARCYHSKNIMNYQRFRHICNKFSVEILRTKYDPHKGSIVDGAIICDCMDIFHTEEGVQTYVLCTGDKDFTPLAERLHRSGKSVVVISREDNLSVMLEKEAQSTGGGVESEVYTYEMLEELDKKKQMGDKK